MFSGRPGEAPYEIDSTPEPANFYGETKLNGERAVLKVYEEVAKRGWAVILRVPVLYGEALSNNESAVNILMDCLWSAQKDGKKVQIDHWSKRYPTNTNDVARVCQGWFVVYLLQIILLCTTTNNEDLKTWLENIYQRRINPYYLPSCISLPSRVLQNMKSVSYFQRSMICQTIISILIHI